MVTPLSIHLYYYPNHQFLLWDVFGAEILRVTFNINIVGSTNTISNAQVHHPTPYTYNTTLLSTHNTSLPPDFPNTISEQQFDVYTRIGAPPYSIPNFMIFFLLHLRTIHITIYNVMSGKSLLNSTIFQQIFLPVSALISHPQELYRFATNYHDHITTLLTSHQSSLSTTSQLLPSISSTSSISSVNPLLPSLYSAHPLSPSPPSPLSSSTATIVLSLLISTPIAELYQDLALRGLYVTNGAPYNVHLIVYDPLTHHRGYNQAPPSALTGGNSLKTDAHTVSWDERDESNAMYCCIPYSVQHRNGIAAFNLERYLQEKKAITQNRLDCLKLNHLELQQLIEMKKKQGQEKKQARQQQKQEKQPNVTSISSDHTLVTMLDDDMEKNPLFLSSLIHEKTISLSPIQTQQDILPSSPQSTQPKSFSINPLIPSKASTSEVDFDDIDQIENGHGQNENNGDHSDKDEDDENMDPLLHVHSRWLLEFVTWNEGKETFTLPYNGSDLLHTYSSQSLDQADAKFFQNQHLSDGFLLQEPPYQVLSPQHHTPASEISMITSHNDNSLGMTESDEHSDIQAWKSRNQFNARMIQLGLRQDTDHIAHLQHHLSTQCSLSQQTTDQPYTQPSIGYPELAISIEEVNGSVRLCDTLHKKLVIATTTPPIIHQVQHAFIDATKSHIDQDNYPPTCSLGNNITQYLSRLQNTLFSIVSVPERPTFQSNSLSTLPPPLQLPEQQISTHFTYFTFEFDSAMSVTGIYKRKPAGSEDGISTMYTSPSAPKYPQERVDLMDLEELQLYYP